VSKGFYSSIFISPKSSDFPSRGEIRNFSIIGKSFRTEVFLKIITFKISFPLNNFHIETNLR
jgi:hypothetical protein